MTPLRKVGLNLLFLVPGETGGSEVYARNLVPELAKARPDLEFVAFVNREAADLPLPGASKVPVDISGRGRARRVIVEQRRLPKLVRENGVELLHSLGTSAPSRPGAVSVVTILDLIYARHPEAHTFTRRLGMRLLVPRAARRADRVITISRAAAEDISGTLGVPKDFIDVVYLGGKPPGPATPADQLRERLRLGASPVVLSVSARRPHKNLPRLLEAFAALNGEPAPLLVLPGYPTPFEGELVEQARRLKIGDRVRFLDWVSDEDLEGLYRAATCFVFPSLAEGFGIPVLEAIERGVPVACSDASSLPEVAGDAARYFDPLAVTEITAAIDELIADQAKRAELVIAGRERAKLFSWKRAARETTESYEAAWGSSTTANLAPQ